MTRQGPGTGYVIYWLYLVLGPIRKTEFIRKSELNHEDELYSSFTGHFDIYVGEI